MDIWNIARIADRLEAVDIAIDREATSLARWIWSDILALPLHADVELNPEKQQLLSSTFERLLNGEPVQYIAGYAWFYGMSFRVNPQVLIPRPETEELVEWILADNRTSGKKEIQILDIGTGSGCIAIVLKKRLGEQATVTAIDISEGALEVAQLNSRQLNSQIDFKLRDVLSFGLSGLGLFDIIVSNPPYISKEIAGQDIIHRLKYEPEVALYPPDHDPDLFYRLISEQAGDSLKPGGSCYLEINEFRTKEIVGYFNRKVWTKPEVRIDMQGMPRMLKTQKISGE
ncbi:MAG: peptide chain release factor N(5)-glutamine methyltransferase [Saprospiraceae bacterium]|nr:peptide chain release factor N(5)-glutamine methyltransferase [Saprospiraceae bacterium]